MYPYSYDGMIHLIHIEAHDRRRKEWVRQFLSEIEKAFYDCNEERKRYKEKLDTIKRSLKTLENFIKEEELC